MSRSKSHATMPNEFHVHYLVQKHDTSYENIYKKYGEIIDPETKMIQKKDYINFLEHNF